MKTSMGDKSSLRLIRCIHWYLSISFSAIECRKEFITFKLSSDLLWLWHRLRIEDCYFKFPIINTHLVCDIWLTYSHNWWSICWRRWLSYPSSTLFLFLYPLYPAWHELSGMSYCVLDHLSLQWLNVPQGC